MRWNFSANNTDMLVEKANSIIDNTLAIGYTPKYAFTDAGILRISSFRGR